MKKTVLWTIVLVLIGLSVLAYFNRNEGSLRTTGKLSNASKDQLWAAMRMRHVVGGYVIKTKFSKEESPLLWVGSYHAGVLKIGADYLKNGGGKGIGSEFFKNNDKDSPVIVDAMHRGQITCDKIENASVSKMVPRLLEHVRSMCFTPLPAFDPDFKQIIVFLLDIPLENLDIEESRKALLQVQLDVHNREYLDQETWDRK